LAAGQGNAAAAEFEKIIDHSGIVWNCWTGALAHLGVARADALQSRTSQGADADAARVRALASYKDFLTLWKDADPNIPILKDAKAEYAKLHSLPSELRCPQISHLGHEFGSRWNHRQARAGKQTTLACSADARLVKNCSQIKHLRTS
jgi:hypothetical protein